MKLEGCGKEIHALLLKLFKEGIVVTLSRQLNQIHFSLLKWEIVQESLAQIHRHHNLLTIEEPGKKESKFLGKIVWRNI
ncbi:hypothetical protein [Methanosarcina mazei]|jgi:hypothetical protein|uniref:Uncharacterized protein n=1 Tax=Methanosarcina mazei (strain ATCC BAA-159 / DSM 3647 / Goe1 / Go1 / JCM 11833 / OCM 88) TaxID=192952 RepID=Q8PSU6_METMA|nr:hypothetical protein [Methanosarcina mazei]AAM32676.1 hypothetical protein MM_2980 [Methanosarcina mazei Go1]MDY0245882.1 hypothetical protein [Methanosarcina mazei]WIM42897.1 hypothetical protein PSF70_15685 [Methanosarcina mazei]